MRIATRKSAEEHTKSIVLYDLRKDNTHIARRTRSAQRAMSHQYYKSVPVKQEECIIEFHDMDAEYDTGKLAMSEVKEIKVEKSVSPMEGRKQCRPRKCERDRDRIQEDAIELHDSDSEYDCGKPAMCEVKEIKVENSVSPMERRKHGRPRKCERDWDRKQEEDIIEFHDTDTEYDSGKPAMSEVKEIKLEKSVSPMERRKWGRPRKCERDRGKIQEDLTEFHDTDTEYDSGKPAMSEVKQIKVEKFVSPMEQTMERRKWGRPRKCKRDRDKIQEDLSEFHDTDTEYDSGKLAMSEVKEINIEKFVSPMEQRKRGRPRKCERDRNRIPEDLIGFHDTDTEYDSGKPAMSKVTEIKVEKSVSHMERRKRGRPRKCERDRNRVSENGMKHINVKSQDWLKNHNKQDSLVRDIQKLVEVEVKKQITKLVNLTAGEKWEQFFHKNAKIGLNIQKSRMEELRTSDVRRKRPLQMSDSEDEVLEADLHLYTQRKMSEIESLQELVTMQCIAKIGKNQQSYGSSSYIELDKVTEDKKGNNAKEAMKKQNSRVPVPVFEENDLPFQDFVLDTEAKSESPSKHDDLHDMWKNMDMTSKGEGNIDMEERKSPKIVGRVKDEGTEEKLSLSRLGDVKSSKASKDPYVSTEIKKAVNGKSDINSKTRPKKCSRDCRPVVVEVTKSPFMCVLLDIEAEANIPTTLENVFPNQKTLQEDRDLEDMWKDMELAFNGNTLNSGNVMNHKIAEDFPDAELDLNDMYCMGEHVFVLDEEIGLICKICKFVKQEIDSILPSMIADSGRNQSRKDYVYVEDMSCSPNLHIEDHCENSASESCPPEHSVWNLIPSLKENMYAHQQEAFEFLWRNIGGALTPENLKLPTSDEVGGCIISHAPGTGKTFLIISFLKTYLELFPRSRPLIIAPKNMLFPWEREFRKWSIDIPVYMLNRSKIFWNEIHSNHEYVEIINMVKSYQIMGKRLKNLRRLVMLREWYRRRSVLLISYNLFAYLTCEKNESLPKEAKHIGKLLLESPGLLVLDEGHQARNNQSKIWNSLKKVKTKLRIILSGTLFQNNFRELFNTLYLVRPTFVDRCLGKSSKLSSTSGKVMGDSRIHRLRKFFMDEIGNKIQNGKEYGKVEFDETLAKFRFMTDYFVHCYDGKILNSLPGIKDFTVILRPSSIQQTVLDHINEANNHDRASNFEFETMVSCVSIHPSLYRDFGIKRLSSGIDSSRLEAIRKYPYEGVKSKFVLDLVSLSKVMEEKVLLFSQNIPPLNFLMDMFETHFSWSKGKEIFQLDGTLPLDERQSIIDQFNDPRGEARVLCASIKTCSEGITLTGASRVVFLDLVWNPAIVKQALSRAFRLGQKKCVYIYRLIASGTMEEEKYERTVWKDCLSTLVFVSPHEREDVDASDCTQNIHFEDKILNKLVELDRETKAFLTIFEHSELKGKRDPRSEFFQEYHNLKDKFHIFVG